MADYDWGKMCCGQMFGHLPTCDENPLYTHYRKRSEGYVYDEDVRAFRCRRGCGTLVWDTEAHSKNVCPEFNPVAG